MDLSELNLDGLLTQNTPQGPGVHDDTTLTTTATVLEVDALGRRLRVRARGGEVWLPAVAGRYAAAAFVRLLIDPTSARPVLVLGPVTPRSPVTPGTIMAGPSGGMLTVSVDGESVTIPAPMGAYTVGETAWVLLDDWGLPVIVMGPSNQRADAPPVTGGNPTVTTVNATATISPQISGTYRSAYSRWDSWNTDRYGGASDIYQGNGYGSGTLVGFAGYGDQIINLGALSIESITMTARKTTDGLSAALTVIGCTEGTRPSGSPTGLGDTASTGDIASGKTGSLAFTAAMRESFRNGGLKGLAAIGSAYGGFGGTATPPSFVLQIQYTKNA